MSNLSEEVKQAMYEEAYANVPWVELTLRVHCPKCHKMVLHTDRVHEKEQWMPSVHCKDCGFIGIYEVNVGEIGVTPPVSPTPEPQGAPAASVSLESLRDFLKLPLEERRRRMAEWCTPEVIEYYDRIAAEEFNAAPPADANALHQAIMNLDADEQTMIQSLSRSGDHDPESSLDRNCYHCGFNDGVEAAAALALAAHAPPGEGEGEKRHE